MMKFVASISFLLSLSVFAGNYESPGYLAKDAIGFKSFLKPFPAPSSAESKSDLDQILAYQKTRTKAQCDISNAVVKISLDTLFGPKTGNLTAAEVSRLGDFFANKIRSNVGYFSNELKEFWKRPRPYQENPAIKPCVKIEDSFAYPSGHAAIAKLYALILSDLYPERKDLFLKRAAEIAESRVWGGVHHPTDIAAGKFLAEEVYRRLQMNPQFMADLQALKK
ncbi:MAG: phosphatase PAP2 family protein [Bdellovibrionales bacterium]|nr:phosphatase PAP2 family protein [Bdellovibrionales bacterium]